MEDYPTGCSDVLLVSVQLLDTGDAAEYISTGKNIFDLSFYPPFKKELIINSGTIIKVGEKGQPFNTFRLELAEYKPDLRPEKTGENKLRVSLPVVLPDGVNDLFLAVDYTGDTGMCFLNGELADDHFYYGKPWVLGLKKFLDMPEHRELSFYFRPIYRNAAFLIDLDEKNIPGFGGENSYLKVNCVDVYAEYHGKIGFR